MDWLKSILQSLPLEKISDILGEIVIWWSQMVKGVPPADLPMYAYIGGGIVVLALWVLIARMLPRPLGGVSWMVLFAVLFAPGTALSDPGTIAPASISVVYAVMMKDMAAAVSNTLPILVVLVVGLFIGFVWQLIRAAFESSLEEARRRMAIDNEANLQLAGGNYIAERDMEVDAQTTEIPVASVPDLEQPELKAAEPRATQVSLHKAANPIIAQTPTFENPATDESVIDKELNKEAAITDPTVVTTSKKPKIEGFYSKKIDKLNGDKDSIANNPSTTNAVVNEANHYSMDEKALRDDSPKTDITEDKK